MNLEEQIKQLVLSASNKDLDKVFAEWSNSRVEEIANYEAEKDEASNEFENQRKYRDMKIDSFIDIVEKYSYAEKQIRRLKHELSLVEDFIDLVQVGNK